MKLQWKRDTSKKCTLYNICHIQSNVELSVKKTVNQFYIYFTVLGAAIKCKQYRGITVESGTHVEYICSAVVSVRRLFIETMISIDYKKPTGLTFTSISHDI